MQNIFLQRKFDKSTYSLKIIQSGFHDLGYTLPAIEVMIGLLAYAELRYLW
jgi:hypothetical protein